MDKSSKNAFSRKLNNRPYQDYGELIDMIESGMEDYEIADELGMTSNYVSNIKQQIYDDMI